jgi:endonuclease YncB( thermonuclease family)
MWRWCLVLWAAALCSCSVYAKSWAPGDKSFSDVVRGDTGTLDRPVASKAVCVSEKVAPTSGVAAPIGSKTGLSPVYSKLPSGAERHTVRNVYDGDTLTLTDGRRVRFLGIDTPEVKENQPFAQEAKAYTKDYCRKGMDIWLTFESEKMDRFGRLLALVWIELPSLSGKAPGGYLCVNEAIVAAGLATVYSVNVKSRTRNWSKLLAMQKHARLSKAGKWKAFAEYNVMKTANGSAYHKHGCRHLAKVGHLIAIKASEAIDAGLHPCRTCLADA